MNATLLAGLLGAVAGALITGLLALLNARMQARQQFAFGHSKDLWAARFASFKELWTITSALPRYWIESPPRSLARTTSDSLHEWFFRGGGLLLTNEARRRYFAVQNALREIAATRESSSMQLSDGEIASLFEVGEALRVQLCIDLGTAETGRTRGSVAGAPAPPSS
jgi:hypothetical protein